MTLEDRKTAVVRDCIRALEWIEGTAGLREEWTRLVLVHARAVRDEIDGAR